MPLTEVTSRKGECVNVDEGADQNVQMSDVGNLKAGRARSSLCLM